MHSLPAVGALVLLGSAIPFIPTGELVSGSAALAATGPAALTALFLVSWLCSVLGDTALLLETRLGRRRLQGWIDRRPFGQRVRGAQDKIDQNAFTAVITGRLVPGGRAAVILALGLSGVSLRRFIAADIIACTLWAGLYTSIGAIGGRIAGSPAWGLVLAVIAAIAVSALLQLTRRIRQRHTERGTGSSYSTRSATRPGSPPRRDRDAATSHCRG